MGRGDLGAQARNISWQGLGRPTLAAKGYYPARVDVSRARTGTSQMPKVAQFFTLMHKRHRRKTTIITSNLGFSEWGSFLKNPHLTAALNDRLTSNRHVINMKECESLRDPIDE